MTRLERLEDVAHENRIFLREDEYDTQEKGGSFKIEGRTGVLLNTAQIDGEREKTSVLALEISHIKNGALPNVDCYANPSFHAWALEQNKRRAKADVIEEYLSFEIIQDALSNKYPSNRWELADILEAMIEDLDEAFEFHRRKGRTFKFQECWE